MARNVIVINVDFKETRVSLIEDGVIAELQIERAAHRSTVGNVVLGKVTRVLPGMQAAFIDVGQERAAFLHVEDLIRPDDFDTYLAGGPRDTDEDPPDAEASEEASGVAEVVPQAAAPAAAERPAGRRRRGRRRGRSERGEREPRRGALPVSGEPGSEAGSAALALAEPGAEEFGEPVGLMGHSDEDADDSDEEFAGDPEADAEESDASNDAENDCATDVEDAEQDTDSDAVEADAAGEREPVQLVAGSAGKAGVEPGSVEAASVEAASVEAASVEAASVEAASDAQHDAFADVDDESDADDDEPFDISVEDDEDDEDEPEQATNLQSRLLHVAPVAARAPRRLVVDEGQDEIAEDTEEADSSDAEDPDDDVLLLDAGDGAEEADDAGAEGEESDELAADAGQALNDGGDARGKQQQRRRRRGRRRRGPEAKAPVVVVAPPVQVQSISPAKSVKRIPARVSRSVPISEVVREGDLVVVQISKEPIGTKGARVTSHVSLPGRYVVYLPTVEHVGISKRIGNARERSRLRQTIEALKPPTGGLIVRTVAEGLTKKQLKADVGYLIKVWAEIAKRREAAKPADVLYEELDLVLKAARDLFTDEVDHIIVDDREQHGRLCRFVEMFMPGRVKDIRLYTGEEPIFDAYGIEDEIKRALSRKVPLPSGGSLIVDQAEALTAIDVNTGRYVGKGSKDLEETALKTNLEAVDEIAYQLRFRNLGGLVILDLIDMERADNRDKVWRALEQKLAKDKAKTTINRISDLGLIEMTRKRTRESLGRIMHEPCFYCDGNGHIQSRETIAYEILRQIRRDRLNISGYSVRVHAHPAVADFLKHDAREAMQDAERRYMRRIELVPRPEYHIEQFDLQGR